MIESRELTPEESFYMLEKAQKFLVQYKVIEHKGNAMYNFTENFKAHLKTYDDTNSHTPMEAVLLAIVSYANEASEVEQKLMTFRTICIMKEGGLEYGEAAYNEMHFGDISRMKPSVADDWITQLQMEEEGT